MYSLSAHEILKIVLVLGIPYVKKDKLKSLFNIQQILISVDLHHLINYIKFYYTSILKNIIKYKIIKKLKNSL